MTLSAQDIYQNIIDALDTHIAENAFEPFAALILLPHTIQTHEEQLEVNTHAQLRASFDEMHHRLSTRNVARRMRHCTQARFEDTGLITGTHTTWLIADGGTILESYQVFNSLRLRNGQWFVAGNAYAGPPDRLPVHTADALARATPK